MDAVQGPRQPKRWTEEEDAILHEEAIKQGKSSLGPIKDWHRIAAKLANRTNKDCRKRWFNKVRGGLRTGPWSEDEDQKLRQAVEKYGQRWTLISQEFGSRSSDHVKNRAADEPSWLFTNADGALSPSAAAPSEGSHASQTFTNMFDLELDNKGQLHMSKTFNELESPTGALQFIEGLDPRVTEPDFSIAGGGDKRSSSFSVVLVAEECDHELVKYLIDVTKPIKGRVKMEVVM
ncbi:hypothetical protein ACHAO5_001604 [Verticillium nonalfalfae]